MNTKNFNDDPFAPQSQPEPDEQQAQPFEADQPDAHQQPRGDDLAQQLAALQAERDELHQRLLRTAADYQNYVRRSHQNVTDAREQQLMDVARRLLVVLDHFDHALEVDPATTSTASLLQGVQMVRDELLHALEGFGVRRVEAAAGDEFDPNRHEAMMRQQGQGVESGHITVQLQPGYILGEKTLRPVKVAVAE